MTTPDQYGRPAPPPSAGYSPAPGDPAKPAKTKSRSGGQLLAVGLAGLAVLLGLASAGFAWQASSKANDALDKIAALSVAQPAQYADPAGPPTEAPATTGEETPTEPAPGPTGTDPELSKETKFGTKYADETLRLPPSCNVTTYVDFDEPRVRVDSGISELSISLPCDTETPNIELSAGVRGSLTDSEGISPSGCVDLIRLSPLSTGNQPIRQGQVYCINTSRAAAAAAADTWKMVIMKITAISQDGTVTIKASSWNIPN